MSADLVDRVWNGLYELLDEDLRAVSRYTSRDFETRMRDDVREVVTPDELREAVDDTIIDQLNLATTESVFKAGELQANLRVFEDAWVVAWPDGLDRHSGFIVSIQRDGEASAAAVDRTIRWLNTEIDPLLT